MPASSKILNISFKRRKKRKRKRVKKLLVLKYVIRPHAIYEYHRDRQTYYNLQSKQVKYRSSYCILIPLHAINVILFFVTDTPRMRIVMQSNNTRKSLLKQTSLIPQRRMSMQSRARYLFYVYVFSVNFFYSDYLNIIQCSLFGPPTFAYPETCVSLIISFFPLSYQRSHLTNVDNSSDHHNHRAQSHTSR